MLGPANKINSIFNIDCKDLNLYSIYITCIQLSKLLKTTDQATFIHVVTIISVIAEQSRIYSALGWKNWKSLPS